MTEHPIIHENAALKGLNTFGVEARARYLVRIENAEQLRTVLANGELPRRRLVLGGGSNVLFRGDYDGLILHACLTGRVFHDEDKTRICVTVGAGENWHDLVRWTLDQGHGGLENLSLIPGNTGAAPIQNIGAYGVELSDRFHHLTAVRMSDGAAVQMDGPACRFGYRSSLFRDRRPNPWFIASVTLALPKYWEPVLDYHGLREELPSGSGTPDPLQVSDAVCAIRRRKLPDPARIGNAGSFFKNPVVDRATWARLSASEPRIAAFPERQGQTKLAAASLIELCGWKGYREGDVGVSEKHALVLVNHGRATGEDLCALARRIRDSVAERFHIQLEAEPVIIGANPTL